jgi:glycosyltransferase involved in cell wall biosynthesis
VQKKEKAPRQRLLVLGGGDTEVWEQYLDQHNCRDTVVFAGFVEDVSPYLYKARLFLLPSRIEGLSNALLEAMSFAVPVIISDIPSLRSVVRHRKNGWVVPVNNSWALADAVLHLLSNDDLSVRLGQEGRRTIKNSYSIASVVEQLIDLYERLMGETGKSAHNLSGSKTG